MVLLCRSSDRLASRSFNSGDISTGLGSFFFWPQYRTTSSWFGSLPGGLASFFQEAVHFSEVLFIDAHPLAAHDKSAIASSEATQVKRAEFVIQPILG